MSITSDLSYMPAAWFINVFPGMPHHPRFMEECARSVASGVSHHFLIDLGASDQQLFCRAFAGFRQRLVELERQISTIATQLHVQSGDTNSQAAQVHIYAYSLFPPSTETKGHTAYQSMLEEGSIMTSPHTCFYQPFFAYEPNKPIFELFVNHIGSNHTLHVLIQKDGAVEEISEWFFHQPPVQERHEKISDGYPYVSTSKFSNEDLDRKLDEIKMFLKYAKNHLQIV